MISNQQLIKFETHAQRFSNSNKKFEQQGENSKNQSSNLNFCKCSGNRQAQLFCFDYLCKQKYSYCCSNKYCQCQTQHKICEKAKISKALDFLKYKVSQAQTIKNKIQTLIDDTIDALSQQKQKFLLQFQENYKYSKLTQIEKQFLLLNQNNLYDCFQPKQIFNMWINLRIQITNKSRTQGLVQKYYDIIHNLCAQNTKNIMQMSKYLFNIQLLNRNSINQKNRSIFYDFAINIQQKQKFKQLDYFFQEQSSILNNNYQICNLIKFFNKKIKMAKRIFKASNFDFKINKYYQQCGSEQNTLIICKTQNDKIVGGFTPLSFNPINNKQNKLGQDVSNTSFIFSLTNNHKFHLKFKSYAIYRVSDKSKISFGQDQLSIQDQKKGKAVVINNPNYFNQNYKNQDKQSNIKFNGTQNNYFTMKQWQVWKIIFD